MRLGPGKHLKGLTLMGGAVTPEEVREYPPPSYGRQLIGHCSSLIASMRYIWNAPAVPLFFF